MMSARKYVQSVEFFRNIQKHIQRCMQWGMQTTIQRYPKGYTKRTLHFLIPNFMLQVQRIKKICVEFQIPNSIDCRATIPAYFQNSIFHVSNAKENFKYFLITPDKGQIQTST